MEAGVRQAEFVGSRLVPATTNRTAHYRLVDWEANIPAKTQAESKGRAIPWHKSYTAELDKLANLSNTDIGALTRLRQLAAITGNRMPEQSIRARLGANYQKALEHLADLVEQLPNDDQTVPNLRPIHDRSSSDPSRNGSESPAQPHVPYDSHIPF